MLVEKTQIMDQKAMSRAITRISFEIIERNKGAGNLYIIGIMTRGAELAQRVAKKISELERSSVQVGYLDVTAYRDDKRSGTSGEDKTDLPFPIEGKQIIRPRGDGRHPAAGAGPQHPAGSFDRPRTPRAADPGGLCRQKPAHLPRRVCQGDGGRTGRRGPGGHLCGKAGRVMFYHTSIRKRKEGI